MTKKRSVWIDGSLSSEENAKVDIISNSFQYGFSVFEGIRAYMTDTGPAVFRLEEHIDRLFNSAKIIGLNVEHDKAEVVQACLDLIKTNEEEACYIRPVAYIGKGGMGLDHRECKVSIAIATWFWGEYLGSGTLEKGTRVQTSSFTRHHINSNMTKAKAAGNYMLFQMARSAAISQGYDEALLLDSQGYVAEGSVENIFIVKNKVIYTPPLTYILGGITRETIIKIAQDNGYEVREEFFARDSVYIADEAFFVGTGAEVTPVVSLDDRDIGNGKPGPVTKDIQGIYFDTVRGKRKEYLSWLSHVN